MNRRHYVRIIVIVRDVFVNLRSVYALGSHARAHRSLPATFADVDVRRTGTSGTMNVGDKMNVRGKMNVGDKLRRYEEERTAPLCARRLDDSRCQAAGEKPW